MFFFFFFFFFLLLLFFFHSMQPAPLWHNVSTSISYRLGNQLLILTMTVRLCREIMKMLYTLSTGNAVKISFFL